MAERPAIEEWSALGLGGDPVPGDADSVRLISKAYFELAITADDAHDLLVGTEVAHGQGKAMKAFNDHLGKLPPRLATMNNSYFQAGGAYLQYARLLEEAQRTSLTALQQAQLALQDAGAAEATLASAQTVLRTLSGEARQGLVTGADDADAAARRQQESDQASDQARAGAARRAEAQQALDTAKSLLGQATALRDDAARQASSVLKAAGGAAPTVSLWERLKEIFGPFVKFIKDVVVPFITTVLDVLSVVASFIFPPLGEAIGLVSAGIEVLAALVDGDKAAIAAALVGVALALVPGGRGVALAGKAVLKAGKAAEGSVRDGVKAAGASVAAGGGRSVGGKVSDRVAKGAPNRPPVPRDTRVDVDVRKCVTDPVDVATGEVVLREVDVEAVLPLERTHVSSYRAGRWFGPSWASTLDQRLEFDEQGVCSFAADGVVLVYPPATPGVPVLPLEGARRPLTVHADGTAVLSDPLSGRTVRFAAGTPVAGTPVAHAVEVTRGEERLLIERAGDGTPVRVRWSTAGVETSVVDLSTGAGRVTSLTVPAQDAVAASRWVALAYDDRGHLASVVNTSGLATTLTHDAEGRLTGWRDRNGVGYRYAYDELGRCVGTEGDGGFLSSRFSFTPVPGGGSLTTYTNSLGHVSTYQLNELHQLVREVDPFGAVTTSAWDRYDRLVSTTDPLGRTTTYAHDDLGNLLRVTRPDGSVVDVHAPEDATSGEQASVSVSDGERTWWREAPDAADSARTGQVPGAGEDDDEQFRPADRPREAWVAGTVITRTGRLGGVDRVRYDAEGNEVERTDAAGGTTRTERGAFDVVTATVDENGARTTYEHDTELRLTAVTDPLGRRWSYSYDAVGRLVEETDFDGRVLRYAYDAAGQLVRSVDAAGAVTEYVYDLLGNEVERHDESGTTTWSYDPVGRLLTATGGASTLVLERDDLGRVLASTVDGRTTSFTYDDAAGTVRRRTPSGVESTWTYVAGRAVALETSGHVFTFAHDEAGRTVQRCLDADVVLRQTFSGSGRLAGQQLPAAVERSFEHGADGRLTAVRDSVHGDHEYALDAAGRVLGVRGPGRDESCAYGATGRLAPAHPSSGDEVVDHLFDARGRVVVRTVLDAQRGQRVWNFTWSEDDRLTEVRTPEGHRWRYTYDSLGRRTSKERFAGTGGPVLERVEFTWDGAVLIEQVATNGLGLRRVTTWLHDPDDRPVAQVHHDVATAATTGGGELVDGQVAAVVTDLLGTPSHLVDDNGAVRPQPPTSIWGSPLNDEPAPTPLRFPGQYCDDETGLHYNVFRYYDPRSASYLSQDPLGLLPAPDPVLYVRNPFDDADPLGLMCERSSGSSSSVPASTKGGKKAKKAKDAESSSPAKPARVRTPEELEAERVRKERGAQLSAQRAADLAADKAAKKAAAAAQPKQDQLSRQNFADNEQKLKDLTENPVDLNTHEEVLGAPRSSPQKSHVIAKHVGKTEQDLQDRLAREETIGEASTFTDEGAATREVENALKAGRLQLLADMRVGHTFSTAVVPITSRQNGSVVARNLDGSLAPDNVTVTFGQNRDGSYALRTAYPSVDPERLDLLHLENRRRELENLGLTHAAEGLQRLPTGLRSANDEEVGA